MLIVPEIEKVVILVPRTGSSSLRKAILARYPQTMQLYRHMEADGVPQGYDRWKRFGVVREPVDRLWSLYKFLKSFGGPHSVEYVTALRKSVEMSFSEWILTNETVFSTPFDYRGSDTFWPRYSVRHAVPENRKSQFVYLRPDLGTHVVPYQHMDALATTLGLTMGRENATAPFSRPALTDEAEQHIRRFMSWDREVTL